MMKGKVNNMKKAIAVMLVGVALTGCISGKQGPDETVVLENLPLTIPPNFELRPPRQGESITVQRNREQAQKLILGEKPEAQKATKQTASWLVEKAGGEERNADIRELMAEESRVKPEEAKKAQKGWFSGLFSEEESDPTLEELAEISRQKKEQEKQNN